MRIWVWVPWRPPVTASITFQDHSYQNKVRLREILVPVCSMEMKIQLFLNKETLTIGAFKLHGTSIHTTNKTVLMILQESLYLLISGIPYAVSVLYYQQSQLNIQGNAARAGRWAFLMNTGLLMWIYHNGIAGSKTGLETNIWMITGL